MPQNSRFGLVLALFGALVLTPDAMFLRWSGMDGFQMLGWRGLCMGVIFTAIWAASSKNHRADIAMLGSGAGLIVIGCQYFNALLFPVGIGGAPVASVLLGIATVPIWAAVLSRVLHGERTSRATWITIGLVTLGIAIAVSDSNEGGHGSASFGALCGLGVALCLALSFATLRHAPRVPLLLAIGVGALLAGSTGWTVTGPDRMTDGAMWAILVTACFILPVSFFSLSQASRFTSAANVSLLLLLETVLGPVWVWLGTGEAPGPLMLAGGALVVGSLALYLLRMTRSDPI
ncbi:DMT family transporter [Thalassococcus lentus]|uniref:DMT family transporter n=1 Tax=Thalassococcus lentus TaxID=1210524 RepID=A0ABT4XQF0_9RHOB|nr:DMT family transporter [Thalassococcus lentus]MDA7424127.1 DMT family transporter [Thalassococcus lentus]